MMKDTGSSPLAAGSEAIILLGHGSRVPEAGDSMRLVAKGLKSRYRHTMVEVCFLSRPGPHFEETFERCIAAGARRVIVIPYFLHGGLHIQLDIPEMLKKSADLHPGVRVILGDRLGYDDALIDIVERRIQGSRQHPDVRDLSLPPREQFPVPPGQHEFVAMPPEAAAKWRERFEKEGEDDA
jgi:sirohydrochlorin ferrochelatase